MSQVDIAQLPEFGHNSMRESLVRLKRETEKSRRKGSHLAARPRPTTTSTTTTTTSSTAASAPAAIPDEAEESEEDEAENGLESNQDEAEPVEEEVVRAKPTAAPARGTVGKGRRKEAAPPTSSATTNKVGLKNKG